MTIYGCTNPDCTEQFRGFTDEDGNWCSVCHEDLTPINNPEGKTLDDINAMAARSPRPLPERDHDWEWVVYD